MYAYIEAHTLYPIICVYGLCIYLRTYACTRIGFCLFMFGINITLQELSLISVIVVWFIKHFGQCAKESHFLIEDNFRQRNLNVYSKV